MRLTLETLLSPADYQARRAEGFVGSVCVVFDVLRATTVIVTGLANGARAFVPVEEIPHALAMRTKFPSALLAGERDGLKITKERSGGLDFDLGNSPREYTADRVTDQTIISTTTNGTRALRTCESADAVICGSFLNLSAVAEWILARKVSRVILVCAGTGDDQAEEDILCAGALIELIAASGSEDCELMDSARIAVESYRASAGRLFESLSDSTNGRRLMKNPALCDDVMVCAQRDVFQIIPLMDRDGVIRPARIKE